MFAVLTRSISVYLFLSFLIMFPCFTKVITCSSYSHFTPYHLSHFSNLLNTLYLLSDFYAHVYSSFLLFNFPESTIKCCSLSWPIKLNCARPLFAIHHLRNILLSFVLVFNYAYVSACLHVNFYIFNKEKNFMLKIA